MPRPSQAQTPGDAPTAATPAGPSSGPAAGDLSPRAESADPTGDLTADLTGGTSDPSSDAVAGVVPGELSFAELFPAEAAMGVGSSGAAASGDAAQLAQNGQVGVDSRSSSSRLPLLAGLFVTLMTLVVGGGYLWWRNRDINYWPA
jgi:hypothetical protein